MTQALIAPFPYFGGKSRVSHLVWRAFGDVNIYVEPFAGSLAVLLGRPRPTRLVREIANDKDGYITNFFRSVQADPEAVLSYADQRVDEIDLHARHAWLLQQPVQQHLLANPDWYDAKIAGWWVWGISNWIGNGWCQTASKQLPRITGRNGGGVVLLARTGELADVLRSLSARLYQVSITSGDWRRVLGDNTIGISPTSRETGAQPSGVFLDPPYDEGSMNYAAGGTGTGLAQEVAAWARDHEKHPTLRIALCGYAGNYEMPGWEEVAWTSKGGFGNQSSSGNPNQKRERIWFSPSCYPVDSPAPSKGLFG